MILFLFLQSFLFQPESQTIDVLSVSNGLSQSTVNTILPAESGFVFVGTQDGLNVFDGYSFRVLKHNPLDSTSLSDNSILSLAEAGDNQIWIGTRQGGLNIYNQRTGNIHRFLMEGLEQATIRKLVIQKEKQLIWVATDDQGLFAIDFNSHQIRHHFFTQSSPALPVNGIRDIAIDQNGVLWIATYGGGLVRLSEDQTGITVFNQAASELKDDRLWCVLARSNGDIVAGSNSGGLFILDSRSLVSQTIIPLEPAGESANRIWTLFEMENGNIWAGTYGSGLFLLDSTYSVSGWLNANPETRPTLSNNIIYSLAIDRSNILWVGTETGGLNKLDLKPPKFNLLNTLYDGKKGLTKTSVMAISKSSDGEIWLGTYGVGITVWHPETDQYRYINRSTEPLFQNDFIFSLLHADNQVWVGTSNGLYILTESGRVKKSFFFDQNNQYSIANNDVRSIIKDTSGRIWIGTNGGGLHLYQDEVNGFKRFQVKANDLNSISSNTIYRVYEDIDQTLWIGTIEGLNHFNPETGLFKQFKTNPSDPFSLSHNKVRSILRDSKGQLWVATGSGLNAWNPDSGFSHFYASDGLPNDYIYGILEDHDDNLWVSTNFGLARITPGMGKLSGIKTFNKADGLQDNEFNGGAFYKDNLGVLYFGGIGGLNWFDPGKIQYNTVLPLIRITSIEVLNNPANIDIDPGFLNLLKIKYRENVISIGFTALEFTNPLSNEFAYQMEGFDPDWVYAGNRRYATYTNLDPGEYKFKIKAANNDGYWNEAGSVLNIQITPPFWRTKWFIAGFIILSITVVYLGGQWVQSIRIRAEERRIDSVRQLSIALLHEFRQPLQVIQGAIDILGISISSEQKDLKAQSEAAGKNVKRLSTLLQKLETLINQSKFRLKKYTKDQQMFDLTEENP